MPLTFRLGKNTVYWFEAGNRYLLVEPHANQVIKRLLRGLSISQTVQWCATKYDLPIAEARRFVQEVSEQLTAAQAPDHTDADLSLADLPAPEPQLTYVTRHYRINRLLFRVDYPNEWLLERAHALFAHLAIAPQSGEHPSHHLIFRPRGEYQVLEADGEAVGFWDFSHAHELIGRFYLEILNRVYRATESSWMAILHASAVSNGEKTLLLAGESGSGKSTLAALLMAQGYQLLADDFVPLDAAHQQVCAFPAALSVKSGSLAALLPHFPELADSQEHHYPSQGKTVRYLSPQTYPPFDFSSSVPATALIFVTYDPKAKYSLTRLPRQEAFLRLIPDSWISPRKPQVATFLKWFSSLTCYNLTYSNPNTPLP